MKDTSRAADISLITWLNFEFIETVIHYLLKTIKNFFRWESGPPSWAFLSSQAESGQQRLAGLARLARLPRFPRPGKKETANVKIILDSHRNCSNLSFISVFSVFQIVKFKNEACTTNTGEMGTCYTESECQSAGGTPAGSCASSFGSCCLCKS